MARPAYRNSNSSGLEICYGPSVAGRDCRDRIIDATLDLCVRFGYETTSVEQIIAAAEVEPADFSRYFATKDAVILSIVEALLGAGAAALADVGEAASPEQALLLSTTAVMTAIAEGRGPITLDQMLAMSPIMSANADLRKHASLMRKRLLTPALADWMGLTPNDRRVHHAVRKWSAIATGSYMARSTMAEHYDPALDDQLEERMIAEITASFDEVMGEDMPPPP
jgi:AcrR family transcriptional regulator